MEALILSCATGGGHHAAALALQEELVRRGHRADFLDPYTLAGTDMDVRVGSCYVKCVQRMPALFGLIYKIGDGYRRLPGKSPVFWANKKTSEKMRTYLKQHSYDVIFITHLFSGEILTHLQREGVRLPKIFYIATDYTCIPFTEELECDYFVIPSPLLKQDFCQWGIPPEKVFPAGIPVRREFMERDGRIKALAHLGLHPQNRYILMAGGSIGAGKLFEAIGILRQYLEEHGECVLIVVCGTNRRLYERIRKKYGKEPRILLLERTEDMAEYLKICDCYISKPGGISSTEAAVAHVPLIHISPIPGCETKNAAFFSEHGMSIGVSDLKKGLLRAIHQLTDSRVVLSMTKAQQEMIDPLAAEKIVAFAEKAVSEKGGKESDCT